MNKISSIIIKNLSTILFVVVYLGFAVMHLWNDGFIFTNQLGLIIIILPFILCGILLDYLLRSNIELEPWMRITAQLLPLGIFIMQIISTLLLYFAEGKSIDLFRYLLWIFISGPFFIASYQKDGFRRRVVNTLYGTGAVIAVYIFLSTQTKNIDYGYGALCYYFSFFLLIYIASGLRKLPYLGIIIGVINAIMLFVMRYIPLTSEAKVYGWDFNLSNNIEMQLIITFLICILIRFVEQIQMKNAHSE